LLVYGSELFTNWGSVLQLADFLFPVLFLILFHCHKKIYFEATWRNKHANIWPQLEEIDTWQCHSVFQILWKSLWKNWYNFSPLRFSLRELSSQNVQRLNDHMFSYMSRKRHNCDGEFEFEPEPKRVEFLRILLILTTKDEKNTAVATWLLGTLGTLENWWIVSGPYGTSRSYTNHQLILSCTKNTLRRRNIWNEEVLQLFSRLFLIIKEASNSVWSTIKI
jgi:hypothetical protein